MTPLTRSVVIHGHFYQPPREDPWLEELEAQPSAAPFHDWNARVEAECYRTVVAARIPGQEGRIRDIVNTLRFISFNFGPTLLVWMERTAHRTYQAILEADRLSRIENGGHGNALAQAYHHTILPLASQRDKVTEVRWGMEDFRRRFGRNPVGMWLPETAVDAETLDILAQEGIAFTIVAPHQVAAVPKGGLPGLYRTPGGREIALFVYDGPLSHGVAFGHLLKDAEAWVARMAGGPGGADEAPGIPRSPIQADEEGEAASGGDPPPALGARSHSPKSLISLATDGETYGHHHRFGEMALAAAIRGLRSRPGIRLENFASFLSHSPPREEVTLVEPTSWSCAHGVERWRSDCGCKMDPGSPTQQEWRSGLRRAMEWLAEEVHGIFGAEASNLFGEDPWTIRNEYGRVVVGAESIQGFLDRRLSPSLPPPLRVRAGELLELERNALRLFTSCGWFFDDLAGLEPLQILRYAARSLDLSGPAREQLEDGFISKLRKAHSNEDPPRDGAAIFLREVRSSVPPHIRVAAGAMALHEEGEALPPLAGMGVEISVPPEIEVFERTTGRRFPVRVEIEGKIPSEFRIRARELAGGDMRLQGEGAEHTLQLLDLPEAFRTPLEDLALRHALHRWVPPEAQTKLLAGTADLGQVLGGALLSAIRTLGEQEADSTPDQGILGQIVELARLHTTRGLPIPFDAQTDFHRILESASPERREVLASLREPLGFVPI